MKKVTLKAMSLKNFRGHQDLGVQFSAQTTISGDNRLGKSTIFDAFIWLLFGKDQFDRKDHEIIPIVDGQRLERVDSEVSALVDFDGREMELKRVLHQKWVRRRGATQEVFDGCDTQYWVNDVPKKASEYKTIIDMMIEETIFKLITNTGAFLSLHWTKQREFLFQMAGTVNDLEVLDRMANLSNKEAVANLTNILNSGKKLEEHKKELSARKKKLKAELETISPKIDQTARLMPENRDFAAIEAKVAEIDSMIKVIDDQLADRAKAIRGQYEEIQGKQKQINDLRTAQQQLLNAKHTEATQQAFNANMERTNIKNNLEATRRKLADATAALNDLTRDKLLVDARINIRNIQVVKMRQDWEDENKKEYKAQDGCLICPVFGTACGDQSAVGKHAEAQEKAKQVFFENKQNRLGEINRDGLTMTRELTDLKNKAIELVKQVENANTNIAGINAEIGQLEAILAGTPEAIAAPVIGSEIPEWVKLENQINGIQATIAEAKPVDNSDLQGKKTELVSQRDELKKQLADRDLIARYKVEMDNLKNEASNYAQQIADIEKQEFAIDEFNKVRIDECESRINGMFQIVKFQLFDKTIDGNEFECCIALNKAGVPISATNTAERINAGLDIIRTLAEFYNVSAPVFIDGSESINRFIDINAQTIFLRVTNEKVLTITNL